MRAGGDLGWGEAAAAHAAGAIAVVDAREPPPSCTMVTAHSVWSSVGVTPAFWSWNANAIVKQPAWAAAISSSGLVPFSSPNRRVKP